MENGFVTGHEDILLRWHGTNMVFSLALYFSLLKLVISCLNHYRSKPAFSLLSSVRITTAVLRLCLLLWMQNHCCLIVLAVDLIRFSAFGQAICQYGKSGLPATSPPQRGLARSGAFQCQRPGLLSRAQYARHRRQMH